MLARLGIEQENRIAMVMLDTVDFPVLFWGAVRAGIIPVLLNTRLTGNNIAIFCGHASQGDIRFGVPAASGAGSRQGAAHGRASRRR